MSTEDIAAIGLSLETDGVEKGIRALDVLASKGPAVEKSMGQVEGAAKKAGKSLSDLSGAGAKESIEAVGKSGNTASAGIGKMAASADRAGKDVRGLSKELLASNAAAQSASRGYAAAADSLVSVARTATGLAAVTMAIGSIGKLVAVQREFDVLNSSLKTVTGSSAAAEREMAWLKDFAKETPFGLAQATQGFVKMKALGLDPTRSALTSFGNTASAMGKDLNQMIEAVADASTGEFERLKEFGIKAKKEGDQVSLTFQGVTTTIQNSAADITKYLENIGNVSFGGAMEERAKTLDGTIAALGDTWDELFRTVSTNNVGGLIFDSVTLANGALEDATTILRALGGAAQDAGRDTGALSTIQSGIATVFETVAVLGANLKFVLVGIGNEIGGLAAQVAQAAQFNFSGVAAIRRQMVADAEAARKEIDATTARILNARKAQEEYARYATRNASAATDPRRVDLGGSTTRKPVAGVDSKGINAANKELADQAKLIAELNGLTGSFAKEWDTLSAVYKKGEMSLEQLTSAQAALLAKQPAIKAFADEQNKAQQSLAKANLDAAASREKYITSLSTGLDKIQADITAQIEATERMGLSKEAIADLDAAKLEMLATDLELQAIKAMDRNLDQQTYDALKAQAQAYRELGIAKKGGAAKEAALDLEKANADAAKKAQEDWERASEEINRTLTDSLMRGFESGKDFAKNLRDTVVNMFKTMVLRPVISAIINPISGALTGMMGLSGAAQAGQGGNAASTAMSAASMFGAGGLGGSLAAGAGWLTGATTLGGSLSAGASLIGAGGAGILPGLGMIAGALGPIAIGIALLSSLIKKSTPHMGAASSYSAETGLVSGVDVYRASGLADTRTYSAEAEKVTATVAQSIAMALDSTATAFGKKAGYEISTAFADDKSKDGAWGSLIIKQMGEAVIDWRDTQTSKWAPKEFADGEQGGKEYQQAIAKSVREVIDGMGLPEWAARITRALPESATMDDLTAALAQVQAAPAQLLQQFGTTRDALVQQFAQGLASGDAMAAGQSVADTLVASVQNAVFTSGAGQIFDIVNQGIVAPMLDAIATGASVSEALSQATIDKTIERAKAQAQVLGELFGNQEFAAAMEQLRTAVGGALGQAGGYLQALPQTLVATQQIDTAAQDAARAAEEAQRAWQQITDGLLSDQGALQIELLRAQGREEEALARERALAIEGMDAYQTALYDSNRALRSQIDTLRELGELLPSVIDQYLTPEQRTSNAYGTIANDLVGAGLAGMDAGALAQALAGATKGEIAEAATAIYNMTGVTDEMRVALLRAAGGLATLKDEAASVADAGLDTAYGALERAVQARRSVVQDTVNDVRAVFDTVRSAARDLFGEVDSVVQFNAQAGRAYITQALGTARSTGYLPDGEQLSEAIDAARAGLQGQVFASQAEADYQKLVLANELRSLQDISGDQLTEAEKQLKALDGILDNARGQIDALRGIDTRVLTVAQAIDALAAAMSANKKPVGGAGTTTTNKNSGTAVFNGSSGAQFDAGSGVGYLAGTGMPWLVDSVRAEAQALLASGQEAAVIAAIKSEGYTHDQAEKMLGIDLPQFRVGTNYVPKDMPAYLHEGEAIVPKAYNPAAGGNNNARLEALVEGLTKEVQRLQSVVNDGNREQRRTANAVNGNPDMPMLVQTV